jgi:hypothetical protein
LAGSKEGKMCFEKREQIPARLEQVANLAQDRRACLDRGAGLGLLAS